MLKFVVCGLTFDTEVFLFVYLLLLPVYYKCMLNDVIGVKLHNLL